MSAARPTGTPARRRVQGAAQAVEEARAALDAAQAELTDAMAVMKGADGATYAQVAEAAGMSDAAVIKRLRPEAAPAPTLDRGQRVLITAGRHAGERATVRSVSARVAAVRLPGGDVVTVKLTSLATAATMAELDDAL